MPSTRLTGRLACRVIDVGWPSPSWVVPHNEPLVLGWIRKQSEQATGSKPVSSTTPWPLFQFLCPGYYLELRLLFPWMMDYKL